MMKQKDIANILNRDPTEISRLINGKRKPSWSLAKQLSRILPGKTIDQWKDATTEDLESAFYQIQIMNKKKEAVA